MSYEICYSDTFKRSVKPLAKKYASFKQDLSDFIIELTENPEMGTPLGHNMFKVRLKVTSKRKGKSGGARVITCVIYKHKQILLADIYDKSDYPTIDEDKVLKNLKNEGFDL